MPNKYYYDLPDDDIKKMALRKVTEDGVVLLTTPRNSSWSFSQITPSMLEDLVKEGNMLVITEHLARLAFPASFNTN